MLKLYTKLRKQKKHSTESVGDRDNIVEDVVYFVILNRQLGVGSGSNTHVPKQILKVAGNNRFLASLIAIELRLEDYSYVKLMEMKKLVTLTGSSGFIGTELTKQLVQNNFKVIGLDIVEPKEDFSNFDFIKVDLSQPKSSSAVKKSYALIHLASKIGGVSYMEKYPTEILDNNTKIFINTFEGLRNSSTERVIYASSSMIYQNATRYPVKEKDAEDIAPPSNIYGFSKLLGEVFCKSYFKQYGIPYTNIRIFNAYGKGEYLGERSHVIADLTKKILSGAYPLELWGDPKATRSFTHVADVASAFLRVALDKISENSDFNVSSTEEIKIIDLAKKIWKLCGRKEPFKAQWSSQQPDTAVRRSADTTKLQNLGWKPQVTLDKGLPEMIEWLSKEFSQTTS